MANDAKAPQEVEIVKNCPACKKALKRSKQYYRNGKYYCNKNCWVKAQNPEAKEE